MKTKDSIFGHFEILFEHMNIAEKKQTTKKSKSTFY